MNGLAARATLLGAGLVLIYTVFISSADAITKLVADSYAAPQLYALSGLIVIGLSVLSDRHASQRSGFATLCPRAMAARSVATVLAAVSFFYAFKWLPFAEVFVFIGMMPVLAGILSGLILREHVRPIAWVALLGGFVGVSFLFPAGIASVGQAHICAFCAVFFGTLSIVLARYIGRYETNALAQVFYPNLLLSIVMGVALPFVWQPITLADLAWVAAYAVLLFAARWVLVVALSLLAAYAVTPLMNLQFVWMVLIGAVFFGEYPLAGTYVGVVFVVASGAFLVWDHWRLGDRVQEPDQVNMRPEPSA